MPHERIKQKTLLGPEGENPIPSAATAAADVGTVLAEISHSWSNALDVIGSSLRQRQRATNVGEAARGPLDEVHAQLGAMAALHRRLCEPPHDGQLFEGFCRALCLDAVLCFDRTDVMPHVRIEEDANLSFRCRQRLRYILVELMTNALKHEMRGGEFSAVWIDVRTLPEGWIELSVRDSFDTPRSIGQIPPLVERLARDLGGVVTLEVSPGYVTRIRFLPKEQSCQVS